MNVALIFLLLTSALSAKTSKKVIYGIDNRLDVFQVKDKLQLTSAHSTAAMIDNKELVELPDSRILIAGDPLNSIGMCDFIKFSHQTTKANCSGFLVAPDTIVTAGHCVKSEADCAQFNWIFDYQVKDKWSSFVSVPKSNIYKCQSIIRRDLNLFTGNDFALIKLDRKVMDRKPLDIRRKGKITLSTPLFVVGNPTGLPTKVASGGVVRDNSDKIYFVANLDTFAGNSGSAVFNANTGMVEGILVRGEEDYIDTKYGCKRPKVCKETGCAGEEVTRISHILPFLK